MSECVYDREGERREREESAYIAVGRALIHRIGLSDSSFSQYERYLRTQGKEDRHQPTAAGDSGRAETYVSAVSVLHWDGRAPVNRFADTSSSLECNQCG